MAPGITNSTVTLGLPVTCNPSYSNQVKTVTRRSARAGGERGPGTPLGGQKTYPLWM